MGDEQHLVGELAPEASNEARAPDAVRSSARPKRSGRPGVAPVHSPSAVHLSRGKCRRSATGLAVMYELSSAARKTAAAPSPRRFPTGRVVVVVFCRQGVPASRQGSDSVVGYTDFRRRRHLRAGRYRQLGACNAQCHGVVSQRFVLSTHFSSPQHLLAVLRVLSSTAATSTAVLGAGRREHAHAPPSIRYR
jgi:hypothetical protein